MAAGDVTVSDGTPICWADATDYSSTASGISRTHQIDLTSLATTDMWQGAKADLGATRATSYAVKVCIEFDVAPAAGEYVSIYWSSSYSGTAGTGNDGGGYEAAGADSDFDGIAGGGATEQNEYKEHLTLIGILPAGLDPDIPQVKTINSNFQPPTRYGFPIVQNNTGQSFQGDAVEMYIALIPTPVNVASA